MPASFNRHYDNVISVAASDHNDRIASFSNFGKKGGVDIAAPGEEIFSTVLTNISDLGSTNEYRYLSGTSMACPMVSGAAALIKTLHPDFTYKQIRDLLLNSSDKVGILEKKVPQGRRLNLHKAILGASVAPSSISFETSLYSISEEDGLLQITLERFGELKSPAQITVSTVNGTALSPKDFQANSTIINWSSGDNSQKVLNIPIALNTVNFGYLTFKVQLSNPMGASLGKYSEAEVRIMDKDNFSVIRLSDTPYYGQERFNQIPITVYRTGGSNQAAFVKLQFVDLEKATNQFVSTEPIPLSWAPGDMAPKIVNLPLIDDSKSEPTPEYHPIRLEGSSTTFVGSPYSQNIILTNDNDWLIYNFAWASKQYNSVKKPSIQYVGNITNINNQLQLILFQKTTQIHGKLYSVNRSTGQRINGVVKPVFLNNTLGFPETEYYIVNQTSIDGIFMIWNHDLLTGEPVYLFFFFGLDESLPPLGKSTKLAAIGSEMDLYFQTKEKDNNKLYVWKNFYIVSPDKRKSVLSTNFLQMSYSKTLDLMAVEDANGDGVDDLWFQSPVNQNKTSVTLMYITTNGTQLEAIGTQTFDYPHARSRIVGIGEFNANIYPDVIWERREGKKKFIDVWLFNSPTDYTEFKAVATQDFRWNAVSTR